MGSSELIVKRVTKYRILLYSKQTHLESTNSHTHLPTQCHKLQIANFQPSLMTDSLHTIFGVDIAGGRTFAPHMSSCHIHMFDHISKGWGINFSWSFGQELTTRFARASFSRASPARTKPSPHFAERRLLFSIPRRKKSQESACYAG